MVVLPFVAVHAFHADQNVLDLRGVSFFLRSLYLVLFLAAALVVGGGFFFCPLSIVVRILADPLLDFWHDLLVDHIVLWNLWNLWNLLGL